MSKEKKKKRKKIWRTRSVKARFSISFFTWSETNSGAAVRYKSSSEISLCQALRWYSRDILNEQSENKTRATWAYYWTTFHHYLVAWNRLKRNTRSKRGRNMMIFLLSRLHGSKSKLSLQILQLLRHCSYRSWRTFDWMSRSEANSKYLVLSVLRVFLITICWLTVKMWTYASI